MLPRALILGFVLNPENIGAGVGGQNVGELRGGIGIELLDPHDRRGGITQPSAVIQKIVVQAPGAQKHAVDVRDGGVNLIDDGLEAPRCEVLDSRDRAAAAKQLLGGEGNQWAARASVGLRAKHMEVVGRRRWLAHPHVVLCAQLEVTLDAGRRVIRALALKTVRQHEDERAALAPFLLRGGDELVNDGLGAVGEIAELRFPHNQRVRTLNRVPVLKGQYGVFGQRRIVHPQLGLILRKSGERGPLFARVVIVHRGMALYESTAPDVLPRHAHWQALDEERAEGEKFAERPIDVALTAHLGAPLKQLGDLGMQRETGGNLQVRLADAGDDLAGGPGGPTNERPGVRLLRGGQLKASNRVLIAAIQLRFCFPNLSKSVFEAGVVSAFRFCGLFGRQVAAPDEGFAIEMASGALGIHECVHDWLGHRGVVSLIVAAAAVAHHVNDDVLVEFLAVFVGKFGHSHHGLRIVPVHVEDR